MLRTILQWQNMLIHVVVWTLYTACKVLVQTVFFIDYDDYFGNIFENLALVLVFYLNAHFVVKRFGKKKRIAGGNNALCARKSPRPRRQGLLAREINHVKNVIDINQLRFNNKLNIEFTVQGNPGQFRILPLMLITLPENAFKHGDLNDPAQPLIIKLCISEEEKRFKYTMRNKKNKGPVELSYGMQNIRNRLELAYRNKML